MNFSSRYTFVSFLISVVLLFSLLAACSKTKQQDLPSASAPGTGTADTNGQTISFSYTMPTKFSTWMNDLAWYPVLKEKAHTEIKVVSGGDGAQYYKNVDLKIGSGEFTDAGIVNIAQAQVYGAQGAFLDLKPLIDKYAPNIKKYIDANPDYKALITSSDGKIYGLAQEYPRLSSVTFYREDMFKKAGITKLPTTTKEFEDVLLQLKETYASNANFYPFTGRGGFLRFQSAFDANDRIDANGKVHGIYERGSGTDIQAPGFKQLIQWYKKLYDKKLVDPEWIAGTATEESWQTKMLTGNGAVSDDFFSRPSWFMTHGGPNNDPDFSMKVMPYPMNQNGQQAKRETSARYPTDRLLVINAKAKNAADIIKFMNYVFSDEGQTLMHYGLEGKSYKMENGKKKFIVDFSQEVAKPLGTIKYSVFQDQLTFPAPVDNDAYYEILDDFTKSFAKDYFDKYTVTYPSLKYTAKQQEERSNLVAKVKDVVSANIVKFVTGKRDLSEWDPFLNEMDSMGYKRITEIDQAAYDAMKK